MSRGTSRVSSDVGEEATLALVHNILPPYRIPFFNAVARACKGPFEVLLTRETHASRRSWIVPWSEVRFSVHVATTIGFALGERSIDVSLGVGRWLRSVRPRAVVVAGWDVAACWSALVWAKRRAVPAYAWVESSLGTGSVRGPASNAARGAFLSMCKGVVVPGERAAQFVTSLRPGIHVVRAPNAVRAPVNLEASHRRKSGTALFVGELSARKGFDLVIDGLPGLLGAFDSVRIAGDGAMVAQAVDAARRQPRVQYLGFVEGEALYSEMRSASVMLVPSRRDPWPLVAAEALTAGTPVVLGPGVESAVDLAALAPGAAQQMPESSVDALVLGAQRARMAAVPFSARVAFQPESVAAAFLRVLEADALSS